MRGDCVCEGVKRTVHVENGSSSANVNMRRFGVALDIEVSLALWMSCLMFRLLAHSTIYI